MNALVDETEPPDVTAALLVIGDEILSGRTKDANIGFVADTLTEAGIRLKEVRVVPDRSDRIIGALNALRSTYDYVFTTGGIGPTHDDITSDAVAAAFGVAIEVDARAVAEMRKRYRDDELTPSRLRMARIPKGAELVENEVSHAPGFMIANVIVMAGVPRIMQAMLRSVMSRLRHGSKLIAVTMTVHHPEGEIAPLLASVQAEYPDVAMGSYPFFLESGRFGVNLVLRATRAERLEQARAALERRLNEAGMPPLMAGP